MYVFLRNGNGIPAAHSDEATGMQTPPAQPAAEEKAVHFNIIFQD